MTRRNPERPVRDQLPDLSSATQPGAPHLHPHNMRRTIILSNLLLGSLSFSCEKEDDPGVDSFLQSIDTTEFYDQEFLHEDYQYIYGIWRLFGISGGFSGSGYDPDFDYLEIKPFGIYGLMANENLFEYGKIELVPQLFGIPMAIIVRFAAEQYTGENPYFSTPFHIRMADQPLDTLNMNTTWPDGYSYHFKRITQKPAKR
jgi:hypothetical protein